MYSVIVFLVTLLQLAVVAGSYFLQEKELFSIAAVYGAPPYLIMNLLNADSALTDKSSVYLMLLAYHLLKYACFFRARLSEGGNLYLTAAIIFEAAYLCTSGYYLN